MAFLLLVGLLLLPPYCKDFVSLPVELDAKSFDFFHRSLLVIFSLYLSSGLYFHLGVCGMFSRCNK